MNLLKELREKNKLYQKDIAKYLDISAQAYNHYEKGNRQMPDELKIKLAKYYNVTLDYMMTGNQSDPNERRPLTMDRLYDACIKIGLDPLKLEKLNAEQLNLVLNLVKEIVDKRDNKN